MNAVKLVVFISLCAGVSSGVLAAQQSGDWQTTRLLHPTTAQRANEQHGRVFIYDGLSDEEVEKAMDQDFDRIGAMMFIHIKKVKKAGNKGIQKDDDLDEEDDDDC